MGHSPWDHKELDMAEWLTLLLFTFTTVSITDLNVQLSKISKDRSKKKKNNSESKHKREVSESYSDMIQILKLSYWECKNSVIIRILKEKVHKIHGHMSNANRNMETLRKNQKEIVEI